MKYITAILMMLITGYSNGQELDPFIEDYLSKWENSWQYAREYCEVMPADKYGFKPTEEQRPFHEQIAHMCGNMIWLSTSYLGGTGLEGPELDEPPSDKEGILRLLDKSFAYALETVANFDVNLIDEEVDFFAGPMSRRKVLFLMMDHVTHHRGQIAVYLRLNGVEPPRYRGW